MRKWVLALSGAALAAVLVSCGGGGGGTGSPTGGITTLRVQVVGKDAGGTLIGVAGAHVFAVVGSGASAVALPFAQNNLDPTKYDFGNPPANMTGFFVVPPGVNVWHRVVQWPALFNTSQNNYQMPSGAPFDPTIYSIAPLTGPFAQGVVDIGQAKLYPYADPPPQPNFP